MSTFLEQLGQHRSIRKYLPDEIRPQDLKDILKAATRSSSSGNMQTYSIIITRDPKRREQLWKHHYEQDMILQASTLLTFCADWNRMNQWCRLSDAKPGFDNFLSFLVAFSDALIAAQNAALAAESRGYGICFMGTTLASTKTLTEFFELPEDVFPATTLVVGVPNENPELRARLPIDGILHEETYERFDDERIKAIYSSRESEGWARYMSYPDLAKSITESGVKNLAQIYTELKYTKKDNEEVSEELLHGLQAQGFLSRDVQL